MNNLANFHSVQLLTIIDYNIYFTNLNIVLSNIKIKYLDINTHGITIQNWQH